MSQKRAVIIGVAVSLTVTAALAIGILLFGTFGDTQLRILGTTALLGGYGLLALPAGILVDQSRARALAVSLSGLCAAGFVVSVTALWAPGDQLGKAVWTLAVFALASTQTGALTARSSSHDPPAVRRLFAASTALAFGVAAMFSVAIWADFEYETYFRAAGALAVADVLAVSLQPLVARLRPSERRMFRLKLYLDSGEELDFEVEATTLVKALAIAVAEAERQGRVARIERELVV